MKSLESAINEAVAKATVDALSEFSERPYFFPDKMETWRFLEMVKTPNRLWAHCRTAVQYHSPEFDTVGALRSGLLRDLVIIGRQSKEWLMNEIMRKA